MNIYEDIAHRTNNEIYIGVVGPVRSGKSTFVKKLMDLIVIPNIEAEYDKVRARDESPQSGSGKTIMTTEPKFIPDEAVKISIENTEMNVRLIDCVGYMIDGALGATDDSGPRMVQTPWDKKPMEFERAAEVGTKKVICDHSTVGIVVTTDGTIGEIEREAYLSAEERVINELKSINKPFVIVLNSKNPDSDEARELAVSIEEKYHAPVALINAHELTNEDFEGIFRLILGQFNINEIKFTLPEFVSSLENDHWLRASVLSSIREALNDVYKIDDALKIGNELAKNENVDGECEVKCDLGSGEVSVNISLNDALYYEIMSEICEIEIKNDEDLFLNIKELAEVKKEYDRFSDAIRAVDETGYGIVLPEIEDMTLGEPEMVKGAGGYGVKLRASAPSIHLIRAEINTEISPIVGSGEQGEEIVSSMLNEYENDPKHLWESNMLGKSLYELVNDSLHAKLEHISEDSQKKLSSTLSRVINEGANGLICILL